LWRALRLRDAELAALRHFNCDPAGYGVPAPVIDKETPVKVDLCGSFLLVRAMPLEALQGFRADYLDLVQRYRHHVEVIRFLLEGGPVPAEVASMFDDQALRASLLRFVRRYVVKDRRCNPAGLTWRQVRREITLHELLAVSFALYQHNAGEQLKKKLEAVAVAVGGVMQRDLYGSRKSSESRRTRSGDTPSPESSS